MDRKGRLLFARKGKKEGLGGVEGQGSRRGEQADRHSRLSAIHGSHHFPENTIYGGDRPTDHRQTDRQTRLTFTAFLIAGMNPPLIADQ